MQTTTTSNLRRIDFDTFGEFLSFAEDQVPEADRGRYRDPECRSWSTTHEGFHGTRTFNEARDLARRGWAEGVAKLTETRERLGGTLARAVSTALASDTVWGVEGTFFDIGRIAIGEPECCGYEAAGDVASTRIVDVRINVSSSACCTEEEFVARGAVALAVIDTLESLGERVAVTIGASAKANNVTYEWTAPAKSPDQPLDLDRLAFFFAHRSALRRYGFSVYERLGRPGGGLPQPFAGDRESGRHIDVPHILRGGGRLTPAEFAALVQRLCKEVGVEFEVS